MDRFQLRTPVSAIRYAIGENETNVYDFVKGVTSRALSFSNADTPGRLHIYGGELNLYLDDGDWVVDMRGQPVRLTSADFQELFAPAPG